LIHINVCKYPREEKGMKMVTKRIRKAKRRMMRRRKWGTCDNDVFVVSLHHTGRYDYKDATCLCVLVLYFVL
jgi:hypothetical protein